MADIKALTRTLRRCNEDNFALGDFALLKQIDGEVDKLLFANKKLQERVKELEAENDEHTSLIDLQHKRSVEASALWQRAHNKPWVWPDLGDLLTWLLQQIESMKCCNNCHWLRPLAPGEYDQYCQHPRIAQAGCRYCSAKIQSPDLWEPKNENKTA